jgi:hypothetical protein
MHATKATNAIVATTDTRQEVKDFGKELGVLVLDGSFLARLSKSDGPNEQRLREEEFMQKINAYALGKLDGDWRGRVMFCKSLLSRGLSFDNCNEWLSQAHFFAEQSITKPNQREVSLRCLYFICSLIAIAVDFSLREFSFLEQSEKIALLKDGFTYGSKGRAGMKKLLNVTMKLVEEHASEGGLISSQVRSSIERQLSSLNTTILGEYFSKGEVAKTLFTVAKEFEHLAMQKVFLSHTVASIELRSLLFCLLDYWGIDRVLFTEPNKIDSQRTSGEASG